MSYLNTKYRQLQYFQMHSYYYFLFCPLLSSELNCSHILWLYYPNLLSFLPIFHFLPLNLKLWIVFLSLKIINFFALIAIYLILIYYTTYILSSMIFDLFLIVISIIANLLATSSLSSTLWLGWPCKYLVNINEWPHILS